MLAADITAKLNRSMSDLRWGGALGIGVAQAVALAPGVSRSGRHHGHRPASWGSTVNRRRATRSCCRCRWSAARPLLKLGQLAKDGMPPHMVAPFAAGMIAAALSGLAAIWFVLGYLRTHTFAIFVAYRLIVASALLIVIATGLRHATGV